MVISRVAKSQEIILRMTADEGETVDQLSDAEEEILRASLRNTGWPLLGERVQPPKCVTPPDGIGPRLVNAVSIAKEFSVTSRYILQLAARGDIPCLRLGHKCVRFDPATTRAAMLKLNTQG